MHYKGFFNWNYKTNLLIEVQKLFFRDDKVQKATKQNRKKNYLSDFVLELLTLFVFMKMVWLISANWYLKKKVAPKLSWLYTNIPWYINKNQTVHTCVWLNELITTVLLDHPRALTGSAKYLTENLHWIYRISWH